MPVYKHTPNPADGADMCQVFLLKGNGNIHVPEHKTHYVEIVTPAVVDICDLYEKSHG
jgi:hypothetical protein